MAKKYDFGGWATKNDLLCSDGRTIRRDAFKHNDGKTVPLVWQHMHGDPSNVIGHAVLENRPEGVYAYCSFNNSKKGQDSKILVEHSDVTGLSIFANQLKQNGGNVLHGDIKEVSLVLSGSNPGAFIDSRNIYHSDDYSAPDEDEDAVIYTGETIELAHAEEEVKPEEVAQPKEKDMADNEKTVQDVFDSMTDEQKQVVYFLVGKAVEDAKGGASKEMAQSDMEDYEMKYNVFEGEENTNVLEHMDFSPVFADAKRYGSLRDSFLAHSTEYGIENIEYLFPDAKTMSGAPGFIKQNDEWVDAVMKAVHHTPFARVKSLYANITADEARARGYVKGTKKVDEVIVALKRTTAPTTVYKHQKLDRDDVIDITDFDVVSWIKTEMRMKLDEEIARAILIGDGRSGSSNDKISELAIRPIWTDEDTYTIKKNITLSGDEDADAKTFIREVIKSRKGYMGSGNPVLFTTEDMLTSMLLMEDTTGRVIYETPEKLATAMRVKKIVTVPAMESALRQDETYKYAPLGIVVNLSDYNVGADKGGAVNMFDDFDIDYNQQKYLIETRCSGALTVPYSAIVIESKEALLS